ncbi:MAG: FliA/WhiG family RNA polymerase sigma factor [Armatimonadota bacterium]|nr:FliA/WhiG family RNA polymerase sigma factor [Armatimonadota bacterium]MDR5703379.1 FliA/WhiG family RNA polymerase sigma factor [Armatimonadota bacterium]MDR7435747.1 FliA/WhiG family RNA polymerase sigma factor [Armatimonadota bacterium]
MKAVTTEELWHKLKRAGDQEARKALALHYLYLVKGVARRIKSNLPNTVLLEDLEGYGVIGLLEAIDRFDPNRGINFEAFALARIRGAILDYLRSVDIASRTIRARLRRIEQVYRDLGMQLGREATESEAAKALGISTEELREDLARMGGLVVLSFEELLRARLDERSGGAEQLPDPSAADPLEQIEREELHQALMRSIGELSEREKLVLGLYYYERLTLAEIGAVLNVTESRASQILAEAILHLRSKLARRGFVERVASQRPRSGVKNRAVGRI